MFRDSSWLGKLPPLRPASRRGSPCCSHVRPGDKLRERSKESRETRDEPATRACPTHPLYVGTQLLLPPHPKWFVEGQRWMRPHLRSFSHRPARAFIVKQSYFKNLRLNLRRSTLSYFNIKHTVADGVSNGNANGPFRNDFTSPVYLLCITFLEVSTIFSFQLILLWKSNRKRTKMKT